MPPLSGRYFEKGSKSLRPGMGPWSKLKPCTVAPLIVAPFWSLTVAVICVVSPKEAKLRLVDESVIDVATGVGVGVGVGSVGLASPPQLAKSSENKLHAINFFMPPFCPVPIIPATQDAQNSG